LDFLSVDAIWNRYTASVKIILLSEVEEPANLEEALSSSCGKLQQMLSSRQALALALENETWEITEPHLALDQNWCSKSSTKVTVKCDAQKCGID
jgi:hypothetical protein